MQARHQSLSLRLLILLTAACVGFLLISGRVDASTPESSPVSYKVLPGDTLWAIASSVASPEEDVRVVIASIRRMNSLETSSLAAGQVLLIPSQP